ncbi:bifunctional helix-turn-helix transcriptional regulator/GNAT family N-acetyltransferase [Saccharibacillus sp. JS10]|uniref:bifunctional helix-turn-helix transcriptional regulator/GNAT family N-acetyltransferase n=1 Tax=Saccharibacillus sp. JS10 TaxID=2950552 RepID=UPI00210E8380|nr:bifunctional helix-turn-helix transcriptional regulator/GNAT family N-acetyltransferase [Saccharibacillus sp. JS10]MCQ4088196.1 bifunctional helix-turn-helix transcriptional regulator/GNAT family N-acetyltransferase [Saccharibacillus sp. JS10]
MPDPLLWKKRIETLRAFNYSDMMQAGVLRERLLHSSYSLTESRVILEISWRNPLTATNLSRNLGLDPGYLSRLLSRLDNSGIIERIRSEDDSRRRYLQLTTDGKRIAELLNRRVDDDVAEYLAGLSEINQARLIEAIRTIEEINASRTYDRLENDRYFLRRAEDSDTEKLIKSYQNLFEQTFGPTSDFQLVLDDTYRNLFDPNSSLRSYCWIAEMNGESAGSILAEPLDQNRMHIKLFGVEPKRRGIGIGASLLEEVIQAAKKEGYSKLLIWSIPDQRRLQSLLIRRGFRLCDTPNVSYYGMEFDVEHWEFLL